MKKFKKQTMMMLFIIAGNTSHGYVSIAYHLLAVICGLIILIESVIYFFSKKR